MRATGQHAKMLVEAEAASYGILSVTNSHGKQHWTVTCSECNTQDSTFNASVNDAAQLVAHFTKRGWVFDRRVAQYCSTQHRRDAKEKQRQLKKEAEMKHEPPASSPAPAAGPDPKIVVAVVRLLEEYFDTATRRYRGTESDETISKKTGASLDFVKRYRRDAYGELAEDPEIAQFRADLKAMDELYKQSLQSLEQSFSQQIGEMRTRLERLMAVRPKAGG